MKRHVITEGAVKEHMDRTRIFLAQSTRGDYYKELIWHPTGNTYTVAENGRPALTTMFLDKAIAAYNDLP